MSLYQKYRPKNFDDVIGNEAEIESFKKSLNKKDPPHTYLIIGPSGCGKTTLARIAGDKLGADELSLTELNSANNRGIESAREIIQQMTYVPASSGVRVWIIDEAHKTTPDFQNAMLKPTEDTPDHVFFFICTTNPEKIIKPLKNRCTQVKVTTQDDKSLRRMMKIVAIKEGLKIPKEIIEEISENSNGSPRKALVILEKVSEMDDEKSMREVISIGEEAEKEVIELCRVLMKGNSWGNIADILKGLKDVEVERIRYAILGYFNSVLLKGGMKKAGIIIECFEEPFYNSGRAGLTLACYTAMEEG